MRKLLSTVCLAVAWMLASPAAAGEVELERFARLTEGTAELRAAMTISLARTEPVLRMEMADTLWVEVETGRVRLDAAVTTEIDWAVAEQATVLLRPDGLFRWARTDDTLVTARWNPERRARAGEIELADELRPVHLLLDALAGYEQLAREATLEEVPPPPRVPPDLLWVLVRRKADVERPVLFGPSPMRLRAAQFLVGFCEETGWPMAWYIETEFMTFILRVTELDTEPDLEGVFDMPEDVRDEIERTEDGEAEAPGAD